MRERMCGVCNKGVSLYHEQLGRQESDGTWVPYHMGCEYEAQRLSPCEDCGEHRKLCVDCMEPEFD